MQRWLAVLALLVGGVAGCASPDRPAVRSETPLTPVTQAPDPQPGPSAGLRDNVYGLALSRQARDGDRVVVMHMFTWVLCKDGDRTGSYSAKARFFREAGFAVAPMRTLTAETAPGLTERVERMVRGQPIEIPYVIGEDVDGNTVCMFLTELPKKRIEEITTDEFVRGVNKELSTLAPMAESMRGRLVKPVAPGSVR